MVGSESGETDATLARRAARGDRAALAALYDRYAPAAYSLAVHLVGAATAEDVVHDAFIALVERRETFDPARGTFRAWFLTAMHRRCLNALRARRTTSDEAALAALPDQDPEPVDLVARRLSDASVRAALQQIAATQREVLVLAYYGGLTQTALAKRLDVPLGTVKARMRRGLLALRALLAGEGPSDHDQEGDDEEATT